jgi:hypothetical protein
MIVAPVIFLTNRRTKLLDSKPLHGHISPVTKRHMPAAMSFLDLERLGVPSVTSEAGQTEHTPLEHAVSGLWKMHDGHLVHDSSPDFAKLEADGGLAGPVGTTDDMLCHLLDLSRGTIIRPHEGSGDALPNPALQVSLQDRARKLEDELIEGIPSPLERVRAAQLQDLKVQLAPAGLIEDEPTETSRWKRERADGQATQKSGKGQGPSKKNCKVMRFMRFYSRQSAVIWLADRDMGFLFFLSGYIGTSSSAIYKSIMSSATISVLSPSRVAVACLKLSSSGARHSGSGGGAGGCSNLQNA